MKRHFRSDGQDVIVECIGADHEPDIRHHLLSHTRILNSRHTLTDFRLSFRVDPPSGNTLKLPRKTRMLKMYTRRLEMGSDKCSSAQAVIAL